MDARDALSPDSHARLCAAADHWFTRAKAALLEQLPCRRGCSRCCVGPFAITILDVVALQQGMATLEPSVRKEIQTRALSQTITFEASFPRLAESPFLDNWSNQELNSFVEKFADLPCPALDSDGSCRVYPFRPVTCRTMGIPVETDGLVEGACEVQNFVPIVRLPHGLTRRRNPLSGTRDSYTSDAAAYHLSGWRRSFPAVRIFDGSRPWFASIASLASLASVASFAQETLHAMDARDATVVSCRHFAKRTRL